MGPMISNLLRMAQVGQHEHVAGTTGVAEDIPDLQALADAFLPVVPPVEGHLEAAQVVE